MASFKPLISTMAGQVAALSAADQLVDAAMPAYSGDVTTVAGAVVTTIAPNVVTLAKMDTLATNQLLGRFSAGTGNPEYLGLSTNLVFSGGNLDLAPTVAGLTSVTSTTFIGALTGNASSATTNTITNDVATSTAVFPVWSNASSGNNALKVSSGKLSLIPATGNLGLGIAATSTSQLTLGGIAGGVVSMYGVVNQNAIQSTVTVQYNSYASLVSTQTTTFALGSLRHFYAYNPSVGIGSTISNQYTLYAAATTAATANYGFYSLLNANAGTSITTRAVVNIDVTSNVVTVTTSAAHLFVAGQIVTVNATTNTGINGSGITIASIPSSTTFTYARTLSNITSVADTGNVLVMQNFNLYCLGTAPNYMAASLGIGSVPGVGQGLRVASLLTGAVTSYGLVATGAVQSDVTLAANYFWSGAGTAAASFTCPTLTHFFAHQGTVGAGSTVTTQQGFFAENSLIGATNNYGFRGSIGAGAGRWNLYMDGTGINHINGALLLGSTTDDTVNKLQVTGSSTHTGQIKSTLATGTAPLVVTSTTLCANLAAQTAVAATNIAGGTIGQLHYQTGAGATGFVAAGSAGQLLRSAGTAIPVYSTATFADTYAVNALLYASATNTVTGLAAVNNAVLTTSAGGVPSLATTLPSGLSLPSPALTGTPTAFTAAVGTSTTQLATTAYVQAAVTAYVQNSQSVNYTLVIGDAGKHIFHPTTDTTARTFTIPDNSSVAFPVGTFIYFINNNTAGIITIAVTSDSLYLAGSAGVSGNRTLAAAGMAQAVKISSTEWMITNLGGLT